jgi:hypothetical protein
MPNELKKHFSSLRNKQFRNRHGKIKIIMGIIVEFYFRACDVG